MIDTLSIYNKEIGWMHSIPVLSNSSVIISQYIQPSSHTLDSTSCLIDSTGQGVGYCFDTRYGDQSFFFKINLTDPYDRIDPSSFLSGKEEKIKLTNAYPYRIDFTNPEWKMLFEIVMIRAYRFFWGGIYFEGL